MKRTFYALIVPTLIIFTGCDDADRNDSAPTVQTNAPSAAAPSMSGAADHLKAAAGSTGKALTEGKEAAVAAAEQALQQLDEGIAQLTTKASSLAGDAKQESEKMLATLREKRESAARELGRMKAATEEAWGDVKTQLDQAMEKLTKAYEDTKSKFE